VLGAPPTLNLSFYLFILNSDDGDLLDLYVFAPDGQTTRTSFSLVNNPLADAESAKR
jgi:hypothetical protein